MGYGCDNFGRYPVHRLRSPGTPGAVPFRPLREKEGLGALGTDFVAGDGESYSPAAQARGEMKGSGLFGPLPYVVHVAYTYQERCPCHEPLTLMNSSHQLPSAYPGFMLASK